MTELTERVKKIPETQKELESFADGVSKQSYETQQEIGQIKLVQKLYKGAIEAMGEELEDMAEEISLKDNKITFLADKMIISKTKKCRKTRERRFNQNL